MRAIPPQTSLEPIDHNAALTAPVRQGPLEAASKLPPAMQLLHKYTSEHAGTDPHLTIAREYIGQLLASVGEPGKNYVVAPKLSQTSSALQVIRHLVADRMLLIHTLHGPAAAAVVAVGEMHGLQAEVNNILAWSQLALFAIACRGSNGVDVPGPAEFGHGHMAVFRKVRSKELMLTFTSASSVGNNGHDGAHFVLGEDDSWIAVSIDPALRLRDGNIPAVPADRLFEGIKTEVLAAESSQRLYSAIVAKSGPLRLIHLSAANLAMARKAVQMYTQTLDFELFLGHIAPCGDIKPIVMPPMRMGPPSGTD